MIVLQPKVPLAYAILSAAEYRCILSKDQGHKGQLSIALLGGGLHVSLVLSCDGAYF